MSTSAPPDDEAVADLLLAPTTATLAGRIKALAPSLSLATVAALKARVDAAKLRNAGQALAIADVAVAVAAYLGEPAAEGLALWARGNALYHLSHFGEALACYRRAEAFYAAGGHNLEVARLQINQVAVLQDLGAFAAALETAAAARAVCACIGPPARPFLALLEMNSGAAYQQLARPTEALAAYERGRAVFVALGDAVETARIDINRANVLQELGRFAEAEALYSAARAALADAGAAQEMARAAHNLGKLAYRRGRYQEALAHLEAARGGYAAIPNPLEVAKADLYRAMVYRALGLHDEGAALAAAAGPAFAPTSWELAIALNVEGACRALLGDPAGAAALLARARRLLRRQGALARIPPLDGERAALALAAGQPASARRLAARVVRQADPSQWPALAAHARITLAGAHLAEGRPQRAAHLAAEACRLAARYQLPEAAAAHHALARVYTATGAEADAWDALRAALAAAEGLRARLPLDDLRLAFLDAHRPIYADAVAHALERQAPEVALAALDLALSAPLPRPAPPAGHPADRARLHELREAWAYLQSGLDEPGGAPAGEASAPEQAAELDRRRRALEAALSDLTRRLALHADEGAVTLAPTDAHAAVVVRQDRLTPPLEPAHAATSLRALQARLAADEATLTYGAAGEALFAVLVTPDAIYRRRLPASASAVERLLRSWRFHVEHSYITMGEAAALAAAHAHLSRIYGALVAPLAPELAGSARLAVALPPAWHDLPLAAALGPAGHLVEAHTLRFGAAPGVVGPAVAAPGPGPALIVGCSDAGHLPEAPREAAAVSAALQPSRPVRPLVEHEATRSAVAELLPTSAIIHLAAHAAYRPDNPLFSWARLADGHLAVADLAALSLSRRPLVVLSACETGRGRPRGGGLVGMARGFLVAGASALVASLWKVADGSTARLMVDLYAALDPAGPAAALARAQRLAIARGAHPFHWAAFVCLEG